MKLRIVKSPHYPIWLESINGQFAIGILNYMFGQMCLQVLAKEWEEFFVIEEYRGYKQDKLNELLAKLKEVFDGVEDDLKGNDWEIVKNQLPKKTKKYFDHYL